MYNTNTANEDLRACHVNCQSVIAHFDEFCHFFVGSGYHIICMSETWLKPEIPDTMVTLPGYTLYRCDRTGRQGGGVAFFLLNTLRAVILEQSMTDEQHRKPEYIMAEINTNCKSNLLLAVVYRPPKCGYLQDFEYLFQDLQTKYRHSIIFGDFNADMLANTYNSAQLYSFIASSNMHLVPFGSIHHLKNSSTFLDLCIIDDENKLNSFGKTPVPFLSAHDLIHITYKINIIRRQPRTLLCNNLKNFNEQNFLKELKEFDWTEVILANSIDDKVDIFNNTIISHFNKHAPLQRILFKNLSAPWLTEGIKRCMRERDKLRRVWRKDRKAASYNSFKMKRNQVQNMVRNAKTTYYLTIFSREENPAVVEQIKTSRPY